MQIIACMSERGSELKKLRKFRFIIASTYALLSILSAGFAFGDESGVIYPEASGRKQFTDGTVLVDVSNASLGYIMVRHTPSKIRLKATTIKDGVMYQYDLNGNGAFETFPLSQGNGEYVIGVYEHAGQGPDNYIRIFNESINVYLPDPLSVFRAPSQYVWFTKDSLLVKESMKLCEGLTSDFEKINVIYTYVNSTIMYDYIKAVTIRKPYIPNADEILELNRGICFDYAVVLAGMLRAQGIPTQLVIGKLIAVNPPVDHAWNKVFLDGTWLLLDATFRSSQYKQSDYIEERVY